jgi:hypothetical protein
MKKHFLNTNHLLLPLLFVVTFCNGQVKADLPKDRVSQENISKENHPKIIRAQGVSSGNITCELQDSNGNLWFSTSEEGVYRYDGKNFVNFSE